MHPFLQFPSLFFLAPLFVPVLLRLGAAAVLFGAAYLQYIRRRKIAELTFPILGRASWWILPSVVSHALIGLALLLGYYTQTAALLGILLALKHFVWQHRYPAVFPFSRGTYFLFALICLSLVFTGAGAFAMDIPL